MPRTGPVVAVALLLLAAPVVATVSSPTASDPSATPSANSAALQENPTPQNTTNVLLLDDVAASNSTQPREHLSTELDIQHSALRSEFTAYILEERFRQLETREQRRSLLRNATRRVAATTARLLEREERARSAYVAGSMSADRYVTTLGYLNDSARDQQRILDAVDRLSRPRSPVLDRTDHLESRLATLQGPVRNHVASVARGNADPHPIYVEASENGVVLSTIDRDDGVFLREAVRTDRVNDETATDGLGASVVENRIMAESYPWLMNVTTGINTLIPRGPDAWLVALEHPHGSAVTWIDTSTRQVYRDVHRKFLEYYPAGSTEQTLAGDLIVTVNRTYAGGPLQVSLTNRTGEPLDGEVLIDGERVGSTGSDGTVWTLGPSGTYDVAVVYDDRRVVLTASAVGSEG